jgi:hypothetical protein
MYKILIGLQNLLAGEDSIQMLAVVYHTETFPTKAYTLPFTLLKQQSLVSTCLRVPRGYLPRVHCLPCTCSPCITLQHQCLHVSPLSTILTTYPTLISHHAHQIRLETWPHVPPYPHIHPSIHRPCPPSQHPHPRPKQHIHPSPTYSSIRVQ